MPGGKPRKGVPPNRLGSKARCDALLAVIQKNRLEHCHFVFTAGYSKESPKVPTKVGEISMCWEMAIYIESQEAGVGLGLWRISTAWGTYEETLHAINFIGLDSFIPPPDEVWVSTNLGHMPRVWLCWFFLKPKGWKVHFVVANHSFTLKEYFQETAKFLGYLYRFVFKKW